MKRFGVLSIFVLTTASAAQWHASLYLGRGDYWRRRAAVDIVNEMSRPAEGAPVTLRVGRGPGELRIAGARADAVRVCDANGVEMLFRITGPDGLPITRGAIPAGSRFTLPAECPARGKARYYVYFDNPSAWSVPDFLAGGAGVRNGGLEIGSGGCPAEWRHDRQDEQHRTFWVTENPHSGKRCLKTVVAAGAQPTWIATRQRGIHIIGGARYVMRAWVKAKGVKGYAGWYIHVGNEENFMIISPMLKGGGGTYDWKEVKAEFTAPKEANRADLGTVLRGTGTAWFDDVSLTCLSPPKIKAAARPPERLSLRAIGDAAPWFDDNPNDDIVWDYRAPVRVINASDQPIENALINVDASEFITRLRGRLNPDSIRVADGRRLARCYRFGDALLVEANVPARCVRTFYLYGSEDKRIRPAPAQDYAALLKSRRNLVKNPSFESGADQPDAWPGGAEGQRPKKAKMGLDSPGKFGARCVKIEIPAGAKTAWTGWRQHVPVRPGRTYLYAAWVKCRDIQDGSVKIHAHYCDRDGKLCQSRKFASVGQALTGTHDWTLMSGLLTMPEDAATCELHLTMLATGALWHDGVVLAEVTRGRIGEMEIAPSREARGFTAWPVNAVEKVFPFDAAPRRIPAARLSAARNEKEPLQIAVRSPRPVRGVRVRVAPPADAQGRRLDARANVAGYVPIDHKSSYYSSKSPEWRRKFPLHSGRCDGWAGLWPDPLLPTDAFDLPARATRAVWVTVSIPKTAAPGDYRGRVEFAAEGRTLARLPFTVHVWKFALPDANHVQAIYDVRQTGRWWPQDGLARGERLQRFWRFMAERRVCPNRIYPSPKLRYVNGRVEADFTEFDKAAREYFDVLKFGHSYTPWYFYCFGWGHPPAKRFGEAPYPGAYPYEGADRSRLRPEFKKAYQACLRVFWNHVKQKGWADKFVLYISDEPWFKRKAEIRVQMKALCDMIHEVDPAIPIYSSTWHYWPEWKGCLDVWGIGHYGVVKPEVMAQIRRGGYRLWFTTDGQMCTDTPYCGVERLLPHYCFKYRVEAYEFWGIDWLTYNPYEFGWHSYIHQSGEPGKSHWVRYPNGDGFLAYPGGPIGYDGPVSSVRLEQAREGVEDYEYLYLLRSLVKRAKAAGRDASAGERALAEAAKLVEIPNAGGRYSTKILPDPDAVLRVKEAVAKAIEALM